MIVGREAEIRELENALGSSRPEFVVVYGRRRVGKTYLIDSVYRDYLVFRHAGLAPAKKNGERISANAKLKRQIDAFATSLSRYDATFERSSIRTWDDAFLALERFLDKVPSDRRMVVFLDEVPWMDTPYSKFIDALMSFWNNYLCFHDNALLAVTGSASSWILDHLVDNDEGFYRRVTHQILLKPFCLGECRRLLESNGVKMSTYEIAQAYMAFGGIPFYLNCFMPGESVAQTIDRVFFGSGAPLRDEFSQLFSSQFASPEIYEDIVRLLRGNGIGYTAEEIANELHLSPSGSFYDMLHGLQQSFIIEEYSKFGGSKRERMYKLVDPFCYFFLKQVESHQKESHYWLSHSTSASASTHFGYCFELLCFNHVDLIKKALGILGVPSLEYPFYEEVEQGKAQIDLVIRRKDNFVNLCEAKWYGEEYAMNKAEHLKLERRKSVLSAFLKKRESLQCVLLTTFGLKHGEYYGDFQNVITLEQLFG